MLEEEFREDVLHCSINTDPNVMQEVFVCMLFILIDTVKTDIFRFNSVSVTAACVSTEKFFSNKFGLNIKKGENNSDDEHRVHH